MQSTKATLNPDWDLAGRELPAKFVKYVKNELHPYKAAAPDILWRSAEVVIVSRKRWTTGYQSHTDQ